VAANCHYHDIAPYQSLFLFVTNSSKRTEKYDMKSVRVLHLSKFTGIHFFSRKLLGIIFVNNCIGKWIGNVRRGSMSISIRPWADRSAPRWANASDVLLDYSSSLKHDFDAVFARAAISHE
jgi:hypothetical protein